MDGITTSEPELAFESGPSITVLGPEPGVDPALIHRRTLKIAIIISPLIPNTADEIHASPSYQSYHSPLLHGIQEVLSKTPTEMILLNIDPDQCLDYFRTHPIDGMIILAVRIEDIPSLRELTSQRIPYVAIGVSPRSPEDLNLAAVDTANRSGGMKAAQHLISLGHRHIGCINLATSISNHMDRMNGFLAALTVAQRPVPPEQQVLRPGYDMSEFEPTVLEWLDGVIQRGRVPTAIFGCDFYMARTAVAVLRRRSIKIPEQVSVIGFDDPPQASQLSPALTTLRQPVYEMGSTAAQRLMDALRTPGGKTLSGSVVLDTELIIRDSTARVQLAPVVTAPSRFVLPWRKSA